MVLTERFRQEQKERNLSEKTVLYKQLARDLAGETRN